MKKNIWGILGFFVLSFLLTGCSKVGDKAADISIIYAATAFISFINLVCYLAIFRKKNIWFLLLFTSIFIVNTGYFALSVSDTLSGALISNRITYLGSVFLPLSMLMIIINTAKLTCKKWIVGVLSAICIIIFLIAASPGYLDIYYKSVTLETVNGITVLNKEYGPWHILYLIYLLGYFIAMITATAYVIAKKKIKPYIQLVILVIATFVNIGVWLIEQLVWIDFEFLSVSYIISELFLLCLYAMIRENERALKALEQSKISEEESSQEEISDVVTEDTVKTANPETSADEQTEEIKTKEKQIEELKQANVSTVPLEKCKYFIDNIPNLTPVESNIYEFYLEGKTTKEIIAELNITENTLKYHNKNIYSKLGVSSRRDLLRIAKAIEDMKE